MGLLRISQKSSSIMVSDCLNYTCVWYCTNKSHKNEIFTERFLSSYTYILNLNRFCTRCNLTFTVSQRFRQQLALVCSLIVCTLLSFAQKNLKIISCYCKITCKYYTLPWGLTLAINGTFPPIVLKSPMENSTSDLNMNENRKITWCTSRSFDQE